jgi:hypothetical protein
MHRTLKQDTAKPPKPDIDRQQRRFDEFRHEYNYDRPHEALDRKTPASVYMLSPRRFPEKLREPEYDHGVEVRTIRHNGEFKFKSNHCFLSELLVGEKIGLVEATDGKYEIRFGFHPIGTLDVRLGKVEPKLKKV